MMDFAKESEKARSTGGNKTMVVCSTGLQRGTLYTGWQ